MRQAPTKHWESQSDRVGSLRFVIDIATFTGYTESMKTYSITQAATMIGCNPQTLYRQCRDGNIGQRVEIAETKTHVWKISAKEISAIKARKKQGIRFFCKN